MQGKINIIRDTVVDVLGNAPPTHYISLARLEAEIRDRYKAIRGTPDPLDWEPDLIETNNQLLRELMIGGLRELISSGSAQPYTCDGRDCYQLTPRYRRQWQIGKDTAGVVADIRRIMAGAAGAADVTALVLRVVKLADLRIEPVADTAADLTQIVLRAEEADTIDTPPVDPRD